MVELELYLKVVELELYLKVVELEYRWKLAAGGCCSDFLAMQMAC